MTIATTNTEDFEIDRLWSAIGLGDTLLVKP